MVLRACFHHLSLSRCKIASRHCIEWLICGVTTDGYDEVGIGAFDCLKKALTRVI